MNLEDILSIGLPLIVISVITLSRVLQKKKVISNITP